MNQRDLPKAYNECKCLCHKQPGVSHVVACCGLIDFTVDEALDQADKNAETYDGVKSVSRVLAAEVRRLSELTEQIAKDDTMLRRLVVENGEIDATFTGNIIGGIAQLLVDWYKEHGGPNYSSIEFHVAGGERYEMTVRPLLGKTAHQLRREAEEETAMLREQLARSRVVCRITGTSECNLDRTERIVGDPRVAVVGGPDGWRVVSPDDDHKEGEQHGKD